MYDYLSILIFLAVAGGFAVIFSGAAYVVAFDGPTVRRHQAECGFDPFDDARSRFDVRFYLVAFYS
jgi:NADH:ubiquinone oxidoreductase subunit 3 (subunit A)